MKKILFISPRNPFSGRYSGDVVRAKKFAYYLSRNNYVKVISPHFHHFKKKESKLSYTGFKEPNIFLKIFYSLLSIFKFKPLQLGYFYSPQIKKFVKENYQNYDLIFLQSFRVAQYVPKEFEKKSILDMGDITSQNYYQTSSRKFFLNPLKFIYYFESLLLKKYESYCFKNFKKILLFSKKEINTLNKNFKKNIIQINFGIEKVKKKYNFNLKNYKIIFIGNIKYAPNRDACYEFSSKILPQINERYPEIEMHIIGEISKTDKFFLGKRKNVRIIGKEENLDQHIEKAICGLANLKISSGIQTKLLTYMSYGLPSVCSKQVADNFDAIGESKINYYINDEQLIRLIFKLKREKKSSVISSKRSLKVIQKFKWNSILKVFDKLV